MKNVLKIRISEEHYAFIKEISEKLGFSFSQTARFLLATAIEQLRQDISEAGSVENLSFTVEEINRINIDHNRLPKST